MPLSCAVVAVTVGGYEGSPIARRLNDTPRQGQTDHLLLRAKNLMRMLTTGAREQAKAFRAIMSALPPKADMCGATWDVRFGPIADIG
jgi:hypothetical protein